MCSFLLEDQIYSITLSLPFFFWCLLKHSQFSVAPYCTPKQSPSSIVSTFLPTRSSPDHRGRVVCVSGPVLAHTLGPLPPPALETLLHQMPVSFLPLQSFLHCFSLFSVSPYLKKSKKETCVWSSLYFPRSILGSGRSPGGENDNPLQYSCLENPMDRGAWRATAYGVTKSWT